MPTFPLYPELPRLRIEQLAPLDPDPGCTLCKLSQGVSTPCMPAEGEPGGVLVISDYPGDHEDRAGRPMFGPAGRFLRAELAKCWSGPVAFDNAVRCFARGRKVEAKELGSCLGYVAGTLDEAKPQRVLAMGSRAIASLVGEALPPLSVRRGYSWLADTKTPVFLLPNPAAALRNSFVRQWFCEDLRWALTVPLDGLGGLRQTIEWDAQYVLVRSRSEAEEGAEACQRAGGLAYDCETAARLWENGNGYRHPDGFVEPAWRMLCVSIARISQVRFKKEVWLWDQVALSRKPLVAPLRRVMQDSTVRKAGANEKFDRLCMHEIGIQVRGFDFDTRLTRRLMNSAADGTLDAMQYLVGMGGGKLILQPALAEITAKVRRGKKPVTGLPADLVAALRRKVPKPAVNSAVTDKWHAKKDRYAYGLVNKRLLWRYNAIDSLSTARLALLLEQRLKRGELL